MKSLKTGVLALAAIVAMGGLSACNRSDVQPGAESGNQPVNQTFGKSYVKQIPEEQVQKKEEEMTAPTAKDKGPALGSQTPDPEKQDEQKKANE